MICRPLSFAEGLVIVAVAVVAELGGFDIASRPWSFTFIPKNISGCLGEEPSSVALAMGQHILR